MKDRPFDIILFGATGFTGGLIARYLILHADQENVRIALAGRNAEKGKQLIRELSQEIPEAVTPEWITADVNDPSTLESMTQATRVIMNAAGPFALYGIPVVEACVRQGTHYLDITGEPDYVHDVHTHFDAHAREKGIAIISACGFDSLPADLGTFLAVQSFEDRSRITVRSFFRTNARFSGGTWRTAILAIHRRATGRSSQRPRPESGHRSRKVPIKLHFQRQLKRWAIPMPVVDPHIVKRSARDMPEVYGPSFAYAQFFTTGTFFKALKIIVPIALVFLLIRIPAIRRMLLNRSAPGSGPNPEQRARSRFEVRLFGENGHESTEVIFSGGDPGYDETSKMFSEAAFCALEKARNGKLKGGVLSPASALGMDLIERLKNRDISIVVRSGKNTKN